ncbi:MAG: HDOD domain-containing protein [Calditrichaeota bacterium]|nr:MAG: HDOD domain-containing protein [Calditrichota bacterium]
MGNKRVLFVDDDEESLSSLRRMLIKMPDQWEFKFADNGESALEILKHKEYDVIVADMRMPKMDGAQLLGEVLHKYPGMVRIILSGHSNQEMIMNSIGPCHLFLAKPCRSEELINTIQRTCALRDLLGNESLQKLIAKLDVIPSVPHIYTKLKTELKSPNSSLRRISQIIATDIGLSTKILQLVNSAFFGLPRHVSTVEQAVNLLGIDIITTLVLSTKIFSIFKTHQQKKFSIEWLNGHNLIVARYAKAIAQAQNCNKKMQEHAFLAGMLHDVGKLILYTIYSEQYDKVIDFAEESELQLHESELKHFKSTHAAIGAYLLGLWGLSNTVVEALAYHHNPENILNLEFSLLTAVHTADALYYELHSNSLRTKISTINYEYIDGLGLLTKVDLWRELCRDISRTGEKNE